MNLTGAYRVMWWQGRSKFKTLLAQSPAARVSFEEASKDYVFGHRLSKDSPRRPPPVSANDSKTASESHQLAFAKGMLEEINRESGDSSLVTRQLDAAADMVASGVNYLGGGAWAEGPSTR